MLLVLVGGGGGSVGKMNFGTSFAPRLPTSFAPRHNCNKGRVLFYCIGPRARITLQSAVSMKALFFLLHANLQTFESGSVRD